MQEINEKRKLVSPDGKLKVEFSQSEDSLFYSFTANGKRLLLNSALGFELNSSQFVPSSGWIVEDYSERSVDSIWEPLWGKRKSVPDAYNEMIITLSSSQEPEKLQIVFRAYNDGIAFKYVVPQNSSLKGEVKSELTQYYFAGDYTAWYFNGEYHNIGPEKLTSCNTTRLPVMTIKAGDKDYLAIHEANLIEGEPLVLLSNEQETMFSVASKPEMIYPGYTSAWRVLLYGSTPGQLIDTHLIELLNPDPSPDYDFSWVKPGMAVWDWRIDGALTGDGFRYEMSYPSWARMVDFCAEQGFDYLVLDANWYGPEHEADSDPLEGGKVDEVKKIIAYGEENGVGIWLYLNDVGGRSYPIEETLKQYATWGAAGVKYGFMRGNYTEKNEWTRKITEICAQNKLLINFHDNPVHPYGQMRTWPNAVTREYCHAQLDAHRVFAPKTFVTSVFVNMIAGPLDMNNGMFDLRQGKTTRVDENQPVPSTLVSEAARTLIVFSGVTILPDIPEYYRKYPALLEFLSLQKMPWVESKTLAGEIGEYIVMMRQTDDVYLVAAATDESARVIDLPLQFLADGKYEAIVIEDGEDAHFLINRETYKTTEKQVDKNDVLKLNLAPGGGTCLIFKPL